MMKHRQIPNIHHTYTIIISYMACVCIAVLTADTSHLAKKKANTFHLVHFNALNICASPKGTAVGRR